MKAMRVDYNTKGTFEDCNSTHTTYKCPNCGCTIHLDWHEHRNYCPECGVKLNWRRHDIGPDDLDKYIHALRKCAKEHEHDVNFTFATVTDKLCNDTADLLEEIQTQLQSEKLEDVIKNGVQADFDKVYLVERNDKYFVYDIKGIVYSSMKYGSNCQISLFVYKDKLYEKDSILENISEDGFYQDLKDQPIECLGNIIETANSLEELRELPAEFTEVFE